MDTVGTNISTAGLLANQAPTPDKQGTQIQLLKNSNLWLLFVFLPFLSSGCCTYWTVHTGTRAFRYDTLRHVERAGITADNKIVILAQGFTAESLRDRPLTITKVLPLDSNWVWIETNDIANGWDSGLAVLTNAANITVEPPIISKTALADEWEPPIPNAPSTERFVWLIHFSDPDSETHLLYISKAQPSQKIEISLDGREVNAPSHYPLLLLTPLAVATDIAFCPVEGIVILATMGDKYSPKTMLIPDSGSH